MYKEWVEKSVYAHLSYGRLLAQKNDIERRIGILHKMAEDLLDDGMFSFYNQNTFPMGRSHFNHLIRVLSKIADVNKEHNIFDFPKASSFNQNGQEK